MSELPSKEVYRFINEFDSQQDFSEFARSYLKLKTREINDIFADYSGTREQKYQMICYWKRKVGRAGTVEKLHEYKQQHLASEPENVRTPIQQHEQQQHENGHRDDRVENPPGDAAAAQEDGRCQERAFVHNQAKPINTSTSDAEQAAESTTAKTPHSNSPDVTSSTTAQIQNLQLQSEPDYCKEVGNLQVPPCTERQIIAILMKRGLYEMTKIPKGHMIIINNTPAPYSKVGEKDAENMEKLWTALDCKVPKKKDLPASEIGEILDKVKTSHYVLSSDYLAFFVIGRSEMIDGREAILAADNKPVFLEDIVEAFNDDNFAKFAGKPKLFFFNLLSTEDGEEFNVFADQLMVISRTSCFTARSNSCGNGCWFVNAIANVFARHSQTEPLQQLLQRVGSAVSSKVASLGAGGSMCAETGIAIHSNLKLSLYLLPGHPKDDLFSDF